jgi:predicted outer membrane repeat protein
MNTKSRSMFHISALFALLASLLGGALTAAPAHAISQCFVNASAVGVHDGTSWATAYNDLQSALLQTGPTCAEIWVAKGVYKPDGASPGDPTLSFRVLPDQAVYGGFSSGDAFVDRNPAAKVTILSGDIDNNDVNTDGNHIDETAADIVGSYTNSHHVVYMDGTSTSITSSTVLDGFTITGGDAASSGADANGGGLYCTGAALGKECSPSLANLTFAGNRSSASSGGALFTKGDSGGKSSPQLTDVTFRGNAAPIGGGGAMFNADMFGTGQPSLTNVTFYGNSADAGGAIYNLGDSGESSPTLTNVTFSGNSATTAGGAMYNRATGGASSPGLTNVILWGDASPSGHEVFNDSGTPTVSYSVVQGGCGSISGSCGAGNLSTDPKLDTALRNNGGTTQTLALLAGSSAIDTGTTCTAYDQRGLARPVNSVCDIGAYESPTEASSTPCYVDASGSGTPGGGASWSDPYIHLQAALANAACTEIWVAKGLYTPGSHQADTFSIPAVPSGVAVYGGFANGDAWSGRNPASNVTILSGDIFGDDVNTDGNHIAEIATDLVGYNSYHIVTMDGTTGTNITSSTILDGFTITGGNGGGAYNGAALVCLGSGAGHECSPTLAKLNFSGNHGDWGGAMFDGGSVGGKSNPTLTDVTFHGNASIDGGGAMLNSGYAGESSPILRNVTFSLNTANNSGGAMRNDGYSGGSSKPSLANVTFDGNTATGDGGAMYNYGEGAGSNSSPQMFNVTFHGNTADFGGAMSNSGASSGHSSPSLVNVILWGDTATTSGNEIYNDSATTGINHSVVQGGDSGSNTGTAFSSGTGNLMANPNLDPGGLASSGGYTQSLALMAGSSAIDHGDDGICAASPVSGFDQRGMPRPQGLHCDIGAYEKAAPAPAIIGVYPVDGSSACQRPDVGAGLLLSDLTRLNGSFDPTKVMLMLDGVDVTGAASKAQTESSPASEGSVLYIPTTDLALGTHWASFTYPTAGGQATLLWSFVVTSTACPAAGTHAPVQALVPVDPMQTQNSTAPETGLSNPGAVGVQP